MYLFLVCFKVINKWLHCWFRSRRIFPLFWSSRCMRKQLQVEWLGLWQKLQFFRNWSLMSLLASVVWVNMNSGFGSNLSADKFWDSSFDFTLSNSSARSRVRFFWFVISTTLTSVWNRIDGSITFDVCLTCVYEQSLSVFFGLS